MTLLLGKGGRMASVSQAGCDMHFSMMSGAKCAFGVLVLWQHCPPRASLMSLCCRERSEREWQEYRAQLEREQREERERAQREQREGAEQMDRAQREERDRREDRERMERAQREQGGRARLDQWERAQRAQREWLEQREHMERAQQEHAAARVSQRSEVAAGGNTGPTAGDGEATVAAGSSAGGLAPEERPACVVCFSREPNMVFPACGHLYTCSACSSNLTRCPMCRTHGRAIRVFMP